MSRPAPQSLSGAARLPRGWRTFRAVAAANWLRSLLAILGALELLMAVSAAPTIVVAAGLAGGGSMIGAAILGVPGKRAAVGVLIAVTLPFAALTWWTIVTPLLSVVALVIGFAVTGERSRHSDTRVTPSLDHHPVR